jgi:hypothetical protein
MLRSQKKTAALKRPGGNSCHDRAMIVYRRYIALLEVLVAFAIIALCMLPLIYSQIAVVQSERNFLDVVNLDHTVNLIYVELLQRLYEKKIPFSDIESGKEMPVEEGLLERAGITGPFPFTGSYQFVLEIQKPPKPEEKILALYHLNFSFSPRRKASKEEKPLKYQYTVFIERRL